MAALPKQLRRQDLFFFGALAAVFLPFLILLVFNHPSVDDFDYATICMQKGFLKAQQFWYVTWQGRYTSAVMLSLNPIVIHSFLLYKCVPLFLLLALCHGLYTLARELCGRYIDKKTILTCVLMLVAFYLARMPSVVQGFYWYAGAMTYQMCDILMLYLAVCVLKAKRAHGGEGTRWSVLALVFAAVIAGCNETAMVLQVVMLGAALVWSMHRHRRMDWLLFALLIVAGIGAFIVALAPGNAVRIAMDSPVHQSITHAIRLCLQNDVQSIFHWGVLLPIAMMTVLAIGPAAQVAEQRIKEGNGPFIHPAYAILVYAMLFTLGFLPGFWSLGGLPPDRTINSLFLLFLLGWFMCLYLVVEYGMRVHSWKIAPLPAYAAALMCVFIFLSFLKEDSNIRAAYMDLATGKAAKYDRQLTARYQALASCGDQCTISPLTAKPATLYFDDITTNPSDWRNRSYSNYFHKSSIVLR